MVIPPELLAKLNDCAKTDFTSARDLWFSRQWWFSALVIAGLVLEGPELWYEMVSIARSRISRFRYRIVLLEHRVELAKVVAFIGWIFIIAGLLGELRAGSKVADLSASIQGCSDAKVTKATLEAGDAAASAESAKASAKVIGEQAAILEATVKRLIWQGPRDILLFDAEQSFNSLREFSGQKFKFSICRSDLNLTFGDMGLTEIGRTEQAIFLLLAHRGWDVIAPQGTPPKLPYPYIADSCASVGVSVNTSDKATKRTRDTALALQSAINEALADRVKVGAGKVLLLPPMPALAPDVIDIHIGLHPAKPVATKHK